MVQPCNWVKGKVLSVTVAHASPWSSPAHTAPLLPGRSTPTDLPYMPLPSPSPGTSTAVESATRYFHIGWQMNVSLRHL